MDVKAPWLKFYNPKLTPAHIDYPDISIYEIVRRAAERVPDECAYEFQDKRTTYRDFMKKTDHVAACLAKVGVKRGDRVLVCMPNCPQAIQAFYAVSKLGAISAMIHPLSAKNEIQYYLNNSGAKVAITLDAFVNNFAAVKDGTPLETLIISSIKEYPAYRWLLSYWAEHADELEVEYDADFTKESVTEEKVWLLQERNPEFDPRFCSDVEAGALAPEDQKLYAEVIYSRQIARMNGIKQNFGCDYLFCAVTDTALGEHPYEYVLYLFSGADPGSVRGTEYGEVYTLGVTVSAKDNEEQQENMRQAVDQYVSQKKAGKKFDDTGRYIDYYTCLSLLGDRAVLAGTSFSRQAMNKRILSAALVHTLNTAFLELLLLSLVMLFISRYILLPMRGVLNIIRSYTEAKDSGSTEKDMKGLLSERTSIAARDNEVGQLAEDFIDLTHEIDDYTVQIREAAAAQERIEFELETAADIQQHMLPNNIPEFPGHPEFKLSASMKPAKEVGGDFYDYFLVDDTHLALIIADVSDKGVPAALFMAEARTMIRSRALKGEEPEEILYYVNNQLNEGNDRGFFVTVWMALLDLETGEGVAVNAGHEHPAVCREGGDFELLRYRHSLAVGMMEGMTFPQHTFCMRPGDKLFVYTDGVPDALNASDEQFGTDRMLKVLNANREETPAGLLAAVAKALDEFAGDAGRFDDTTMLCFFCDKQSDIT